MKKPREAKTFLAISLAVMLNSVSCVQGGIVNTKTSIDAETIYQGTLCHAGQSEPHLQWEQNREAFEARWKKQFSQLLGGAIVEPPEVDFDRYGVLLIHMGIQRTGGYALELADSKITVEDQVATVRVHWNAPPADGIVPQMVTRPCLILKLGKGKFDRIEVVDESANVRLVTGTTASY